MTQRAIVAVQRGTNSYDIHYSANGADDLHLTSKLEDNFQNGSLDIESVAAEDEGHSKQIKKWHENAKNTSDNKLRSPNLDNDLINVQPRYTDVPLNQVGSTFEYDNIEAFYLVKNGHVETYFPVWLEPNVIRPFREHTSIEVYTHPKLSSNIHEYADELEEKEPQRVINNETLSGTEWTNDTILWDVMFRNHEAINVQQRLLTEKQEFFTEEQLEQADNKGQSILQVGGRIILITTDSSEPILPVPMGRGILIQIDNHDTIEYANVRDKANEARMETGIRLNTPSEPPTDGDINEEMHELLKTLLLEYPDRASTLSPKPFNKIIKAINKS